MDLLHLLWYIFWRPWACAGVLYNLKHAFHTLLNGSEKAMNDLLIWFYRYIYKLLTDELLLSRNLFDLRLSRHFFPVLCTFVIQLHHYTHKIYPHCKSLWLIHTIYSETENWMQCYSSYPFYTYILYNPLHTNVCSCKLCAQFRKSTVEKLYCIFMFILTLVLQSEFVGKFSTQSYTKDNHLWFWLFHLYCYFKALPSLDPEPHITWSLISVNLHCNLLMSQFNGRKLPHIFAWCTCYCHTCTSKSLQPFEPIKPCSYAQKIWYRHTCM